jgi:hypothetical protein
VDRDALADFDAPGELPRAEDSSYALVPGAEWIGVEFAEATGVGDEVPAADAADLHLDEDFVRLRFGNIRAFDFDLPFAQIPQGFSLHAALHGIA